MIVLGDVLCNVERKRRLAHPRTSGDDDEVGGVESGKLAVEVPKPGRDAGDIRAEPLEFFCSLDRRAEQRVDRCEAFADAMFRDLEHLLFGTVKHVRNRLCHLRGISTDRATDSNEAPTEGMFFDDTGVCLLYT